MKCLHEKERVRVRTCHKLRGPYYQEWGSYVSRSVGTQWLMAQSFEESMLRKRSWRNLWYYLGIFMFLCYVAEIFISLNCRNAFCWSSRRIIADAGQMRFHFLAKSVIFNKHINVHMGGTKTRGLRFMYPNNGASVSKWHYYVNTCLL